jgi:hypothetical protein
MGQLPDLPQPEPPAQCTLHGVLAEVCGGPHRVVTTDLGDEVLAPDEAPLGKPLD